MIPAIYARILIVSLCLLALAASASAECAWIVWSYTPNSPTAWEVRTAASDQDMCFQVVKRMEEKLKAENIKPSGALVCIPDTVDPRGPKRIK